MWKTVRVDGFEKLARVSMVPNPVPGRVAPKARRLGKAREGGAFAGPKTHYASGRGMHHVHAKLPGMIAVGNMLVRVDASGVYVSLDDRSSGGPTPFTRMNSTLFNPSPASGMPPERPLTPSVIAQSDVLQVGLAGESTRGKLGLGIAPWYVDGYARVEIITSGAVVDMAFGRFITDPELLARLQGLDVYSVSR